MNRRNLFALALGSLVAVGGLQSAAAAEKRPFDRAQFEAAQAQGRPILVDVYADWCSTCKAQAPIVDEVVARPEFDRLIVFKLNFDEQKTDWRRLKVQRQSTLIAYRGRTETGRLVAETKPAAIAAVIGSTLR